MNEPKTIVINDVEYVRKSDAFPVEIGEKRIIVFSDGWVFVGNCTDEENGKVTMRNAKNIRRWGTTKGLGELKTGPTDDTVVDDYGTVSGCELFSVAVIGGW